MKINTVKFSVNGEYIINDGIMAVENNPSATGYDRVQDWIDEGNMPEPYVEPEPSWTAKRLANMAGGGYGSIGEQLEMIGEQGMDVFQAHIAKVKSDIPKE